VEDARRWQGGAVVDIAEQWVTIATGEGLLDARTMRLEGEELPACEVLRRLDCAAGDVLKTVPWVKNLAA
jgi:hypothetical protein